MNKKLIKSSWQNQKVYTSEQLINFFGLSPAELNQIYRDNRTSFIQNTDYFILTDEDAEQYKKSLEKDDKRLLSSVIFLFTQSGVKKLITLSPTKGIEQ